MKYFHQAAHTKHYMFPERSSNDSYPVLDVFRKSRTVLSDKSHTMDGICKKLEKDKYLVILRKQAVTQLQSTRFELFLMKYHLPFLNLLHRMYMYHF